MKAIVLILIFFGYNAVQAQDTRFAIINDSDGFTNVRLGKSKQIVDRIKSNQVFAVKSIVDDDGWQNWFWIKYPDLKKGNKPLENFSQKSKEGMIHKSRIQYLNKLPQFETEVLSGNTILFSKNNIKIEVTIGKFDALEHKISKDKQGLITKIDKAEYWGIDGRMNATTTEIKKIKIHVGNVETAFPENSFKNILMPTIDKSAFGVAESNANTLFLYMSNGNGTASYDVVWTIKNGKIVSRFVYRWF
jgi:hypothetical protein